MLIIAGHLTVDAARRDAYLADCVAIVEAARCSPGCLDFALSADLVDPGRILVHERWASEEELLAFRGAGPGSDQQDAILDADVHRYLVSRVEAP